MMIISPKLPVLLLVIASAQSKLFSIVGFEHKPYLQTENGVYTGFIPDLLNAIAEVEPFSYKMVTPRDGKYGGNVGGEWNGMIGMVARKEADLVAADLTMTSKRMEILDFSLPFLSTTVTVLMKSDDVAWNLHRGSQGMMATPSLPANPTTVQQLLNMTNTRFGCYGGGSTHQMLKSTHQSEHQQIFSNIDALQGSNGEGVEKVKSESGFGMVMEKMSADYEVGKDKSCRLYTVGQLTYVNYGFGFAKGSDLREMFSRGILKVTVSGKMFSLLNKWFPENQNCFSSRISAAGSV